MALESQTGSQHPALAAFLGRDVIKRIAFTLAALAIYRLGLIVPVPGLDVSAMPGLTPPFDTLSRTALARVSIFDLGLGPIFSIMIAAEVLKLAAPALSPWLAKSEANRHAFNRYVLLAGLVLAAFQAYGVAIALEEVKAYGNVRLVPEPGVEFQVAFILSVVAGTAFLAWLGDQITRHGVGSLPRAHQRD